MKFIDSNVFIYAADSKNHEKRAIARKLISSAPSGVGRCDRERSGCDESVRAPVL